MIYCDGEKNCQHQCTSPKKILTHEGWNFRWTTPQRSLVKSIIPGPFLHPKLVHARPYVVTSGCKNCATRKMVRQRKLRNGIPDPWLEYLAWKDKSSPKDVRCSREYMWLTDHVWNSRGLKMVQGIPDPWREDDFDCVCFEIESKMEDETTRKKSKDFNCLCSEIADKMEDRTTRKKSKDEDSRRASAKRHSKNSKDFNCLCSEIAAKMKDITMRKKSKDEDSRRSSEKRDSKNSKDFNCLCSEIAAKMKDKTTRKKSKDEDSRRASAKRDSKDSKGKTSRRASAKRDSKGKSDENEKVASGEKKHQRNVYERVKDSMEELEEELRLKEEEMKRSHSSSKATAGSKSKTRKSIDDKLANEMDKLFAKKTKDENVKESKRESKVSFDGMNKKILRCNDDISKIRKDAILAQHKIQKLKEKDLSRNKKKDSLCTGNCGRVCKRNETLLNSIKLSDEASSAITTRTDSVESVKEFLKEINERIAITKNVLNSPDMKTTITKNERRERGGGDKLVKVNDQRQPSLFSRRCNDISKIPIDVSDDNIPDHVDKSEERYYRNTASLQLTRRTTNCFARDSPTLIVESFSEQD